MKLKFFYLNENKHLEASSKTAFIAALRDGKSHYWIDVENPDPATLKELLHPLHLHPLILEVCLDAAAGSRITPYEGSLLIKLPAKLDRDNLDQSFLSIICLPRSIITIRESSFHSLESIAAEFCSAMRFHTFSTSAILYQIIDRLIDEDTAFVLEASREIELLEETMDDASDSVRIDQILLLKQRLARLSIIFEDQRYCVTALQTIESEVFDITDLREYFRDSLANLEYAIRSIGRQQAHLAELRQHYQLSLQERTNKRLRVLTILSAIFMPLTLIAGIYGMNFKYMPELRWPYAYPVVIAVMFTISAVLLWIFYRKGWFK